MSRIVALNEVKSNEKPKEENCNQELQETLAETEYMRAIKLKTQGKHETALFLLNELLQTKVLTELSTEDNKNKKLHLIRYNCYKNAAFIYEEQLKNNDKALENYIIALQIDNSDVYLSQRCAQLALKMNLPELAEYYFENCLQHNQFHCLAADGLLQAMCRDNNILGCYYLACKLLERNRNMQSAKRVLKEISERFPHLYRLYKEFKQIDGMDEIIQADTKLADNVVKRKRVFAEQSVRKHKSLDSTIDIKKFQLKFIELSWHTIGKYVVDVYAYLRKRQYPFYMLRIEDMVDAPDVKSLDLLAIEQSNLDSNGRPKRRKRCSDVELLQQWSWWPKGRTHKNVRFDLPDAADDDICLRYYLAECCDVCKKLKISLIDFDVQTKSDFSAFITDLMPRQFDLIFLNELWLKFVSQFSNLLLPNEINALYFEAFNIYKSNFDVHLWNQLDDPKDLENAVHILLFYLEMYLTKLEGPEKPSKEWETLFYALKLKLQQTHLPFAPNYHNFKLRILNLEYLWTLYENHVDECIACLLSLEKALENESEDYTLHLPNGYCICKEKIVEIREEIEEEISSANEEEH